jgi:hypothetical protein
VVAWQAEQWISVDFIADSARRRSRARLPESPARTAQECTARRGGNKPKNEEAQPRPPAKRAAISPEGGISSMRNGGKAKYFFSLKNPVFIGIFG